MNLYSSHLLSMETLLEGGSPSDRNTDLTPRLMVILGHEAGRTFRIGFGDSTVGREKTCHFALNDPSISRVHASINRAESGEVRVTDLSSRNGTFINDHRVEQNGVLSHGDIIRVGNVLLKFFEFGSMEAEVFQRVFELALNDTLTETLTKTAICAQLDLLIQNHTGPVSVVMADIDHFKQVNDTYGHVMGDVVLHQTVAAIKQSILRPNDLIGRFGGEEFLIILPDTILEQALVMAEEARQAVAANVIQDQGQSVKVTASFGVTCRRTGETVTLMTTQNILEKADKALYMAKNQGRNQVCHIV